MGDDDTNEPVNPDDDAFESIINNQPDDEDEDEGGGLDTLWEAIDKLWPHFYPGMLIKGIVLAEIVEPDGERVMRFIASPSLAPWEMLGLLESARLDARRLSQYYTVADNDDDDSGGGEQ